MDKKYMEELLTGNLQITQTYSPNKKTEIYKQQSRKQKDLLDKLGH